MFEKEVYKARREALKKKMSGGIAVFPGNSEAPENYLSNQYRFRQDSSFLYFFGIDEPDFAAVIDFDSGEEMIFGNDVSIDDIIWMGPQPTVASKAERIGISKSRPFADLFKVVGEAVAKGRKVHFLPPYRYYNMLLLSELIGVPCSRNGNDTRKMLAGLSSVELTKAVISLRLIKEACEIEEIDKACDIGYEMHYAAMKNARLGMKEQELVGLMEGITVSKGWGPSFAIILSQNGETLHNHTHHQYLTEGRLFVIDAGAESNTHYASDFTRTLPASGKFTEKQKEIYTIVSDANNLAIEMARPGITYKDVHLATARLMLEGLSSVGIVKGDLDEMVEKGVMGLFQPHGLGHNMGLDVHDMEDLGEDLVGYDDDQKRSPQLGLGSLRMARRLKPGHVITDEPGIDLLQFGEFIAKSVKQYPAAEQLDSVEKRKRAGGRIDQRLCERSEFRRLSVEQRPPGKQFSASQHGKAEVYRQMGALRMEMANPAERWNQKPHAAPERHRASLILQHGLAPAPKGEQQPCIGIFRDELAATGSIEKIAEFQLKAVAQRQKIVPQCVHNPLLS